MSSVSPKLRFPNSTGEWEASPISEKLTKVIDYRGKAPPKADSGVPLITARNVRDGYLDFTADEYVDESLYDSWMRRGIPKANDVLFTTEAPLANIALFPSNGRYALGQRIITLQTEPAKCDSVFLFHLLRSETAQRAIDARSTGTTAKGIKSKVFVKIPLHSPELPEQRKIADFLTAVDGRIGQLIQKKALLEDYKKGVMQQLFTQAIRFKDDHGNDFPDWEEKKLGEVAELISGFAFKSEHFGEGGERLITPKNFTKNGMACFDVANTKYTTEDVPEKFKCDSGDLLVLLTDLTPSCELLGRPALLNKSDGVVLLNQRIAKVVVNGEHLSTPYLANFLQSPKYRKRIIRSAVGSTVRHSSNKILLSTATPIPSLEEQTKIADFLSAIDRKIESVATQITETQTFKRGLLQQMFV